LAAPALQPDDQGVSTKKFALLLVLATSWTAFGKLVTVDEICGPSLAHEKECRAIFGNAPGVDSRVVSLCRESRREMNQLGCFRAAGQKEYTYEQIETCRSAAIHRKNEFVEVIRECLASTGRGRNTTIVVNQDAKNAGSLEDASRQQLADALVQIDKGQLGKAKALISEVLRK